MLVAKVNDYEISYSEYQAELHEIMKLLKTEEPNDHCKKKAIEKLIDAVLLLNEAKKTDISIDPEEVESSIIECKLEYESQEEFEEALSNNNITLDDLKTKLKSKIIIKKYIKSLTNENFSISDERLEEIYKENLELFKIQKKIRVSHILLKKEIGKKRAEEIRAKINTPQDFINSVEKCSQCPSCKQSGDLGFITEGKMVREFDQVAFKLPVNMISDPIETEFGFHIIMVTDIVKERTLPFELVKDTLFKRLKDIDFQLRLLNHLKELKHKAEITVFHENL